MKSKKELPAVVTVAELNHGKFAIACNMLIYNGYKMLGGDCAAHYNPHDDDPLCEYYNAIFVFPEHLAKIERGNLCS